MINSKVWIEIVKESFQDVKEQKTQLASLYLLQILIVIHILTQVKGDLYDPYQFVLPVASLFGLGFLYLFTSIAGKLKLKEIKKTGLRSLKLFLYLLLFSLTGAAVEIILPTSSLQINSIDNLSINKVIIQQMFSIQRISQLVVFTSYFIGGYKVANGHSIRESVKESLNSFIEEPVQIGILLALSNLAVFIPLIIFSLPGLIIDNLITVKQIRLPPSIFLTLLGTSIGGIISIRIPSNWINKKINRN